MSGQRVSRIWADTIRREVCKHAQCRKPIWFAQNVKTGNFMPFTGEPTPLSVQRELESNREEWTVDLAASHFADCPGAPGFRRKK